MSEKDVESYHKYTIKVEYITRKKKEKRYDLRKIDWLSADRWSSINSTYYLEGPRWESGGSVVSEIAIPTKNVLMVLKRCSDRSFLKKHYDDSEVTNVEINATDPVSKTQSKPAQSSISDWESKTSQLSSGLRAKTAGLRWSAFKPMYAPEVVIEDLENVYEIKVVDNSGNEAFHVFRQKSVTGNWISADGKYNTAGKDVRQKLKWYHDRKYKITVKSKGASSAPKKPAAPKPKRPATRSTAAKPKTAAKKTAKKRTTIKGKTGYELVTKTRKSYCVGPSKQTYWKRNK